MDGKNIKSKSHISNESILYEDLLAEWYESVKQECDKSPFGCMIINKKGIIE